jgi:molybdenum cofactor cytidylyltransferase
MIFGEIPAAEAVGAILAHGVRQGGVSFRKGRVLSQADAQALRAAGVAHVVAARLEAGDVHEDEAAERLARALAGAGITASAPFTGRVNLFAASAGVAVVDRERIDRINRIDEALTVATLPAYSAVTPRQMLATVKIIPFAAPGPALAVAEAVALRADLGPAIAVAPFAARKAGLIQTRLAATKASVLDKTVEVTAARLVEVGASLARERRCSHAATTVAAEIRAMLAQGIDLVLIAGASAITDRRDVLPAAIEAAGGTIEHFGMPVDPGNLLLLGRIGEVPVLGLPGCARSPRINGFDWVLQRLAAGVRVSRADITAMGVGGLLTEIPTRPLPRAEATEGRAAAAVPRAPRVAAVVLAAGQSRRMGPANKLLAMIEGQPMVARSVDAALASSADPVIVVTGHQRAEVEAALAGRRVRIVHNQAYSEGLSTSLRAGLAALPAEVDAALVVLGDMPRVTAAEIDRLIAAYDRVEGRLIVVPTSGGKRGNPVLWDRGFFAEMAEVSGDVGARHLIGAHAEAVVEVELGAGGVLLDIDTPEALAELAP